VYAGHSNSNIALMKLQLNKRAQLVLKSLGLLALSISLLATSLISISSADENCSKSNLDRLAAEKIELQKIIDTEPENITFTVSEVSGETSTVTIGNVNRQTALLQLEIIKIELDGCASFQERQVEKAKKDVFDEIEGFEVDIEADISVKKLVGKHQINISSNLASGSFELLALKKNSKTIKFVFNTDEDGNKKFTTKRNLSGYRLVLKDNNEQIKSFAIN
jgi:hypothetical protein